MPRPSLPVRGFRMMWSEPNDFCSCFARSRVPSGEASSTTIISHSRFLLLSVSAVL